MGRTSDRHRGIAAVAVLLALIVICWAPPTSVVAQAPQPPAGERRFDVASVKPASPLQERIAQASRAGGPPPTVYDMRALPGGRFTATMASLRMLVGYAFDVRDYQIEGGPPWSSTDYFDIAASAGSDATPEEVRAMVKTLLVDRLRLRARLETRQAPVHVLTIARSDGRLGPALTRTSPDCERQLAERKNGAPPKAAPESLVIQTMTAPTCGGMMLRGTGTGGTMALMGGVELTRLVSLVSSSLGAPVVDRTGLSGLFDFTLEYMPDRQVAGRRPGLDPNINETPPPPMAMALQQQLGLALEKQMGPLPIVVIDAADHPLPD